MLALWHGMEDEVRAAAEDHRRRCRPRPCPARLARRVPEKGKAMSYMKRFAEEVSISMGLGGEINDEVLAEAQRRLDGMSRDESQSAEAERLDRLTSSELGEEECLRQTGDL